MFALLSRVSSLEPYLYRRILLIGADSELERLGSLMESRNDCRVVASFCMRPQEPEAQHGHAAQDEEDIELAKSLVRLMRPSEIILALPLGDTARIRRIVSRLGEAPSRISLYLQEVFSDPGITMAARETLEDRLVRRVT